MRPYIDAVVSFDISTRSGVVTKIENVGYHQMVTVHLIDHKTGSVLQCPDERCRNSPGCPIHQMTIDSSHLMVWNKKDILYYASVGMLTDEIARKAINLRIELHRIKERIRADYIQQNVVERSIWLEKDAFPFLEDATIGVLSNPQDYKFKALTNRLREYLQEKTNEQSDTFGTPG